MSILGSDPFDTLIYQQGLVGTPLVEGGAGGADDLDVAQRSITIGEVVPIVFGRRVGEIGGVLISPGATEARFENSLTNEVTASYHVVLSEGQLPGIQVRDVFQRSCRVGSFTQTYGRRAGPWLPGNFIVPRVGFTKPECPYYCGTGGTYADMTTGSYVIEDVPDGDTRWDRQIHLFCRGGMQVTRLLDATYGPSNNIADLVLYLLRKTSRVPAGLIDTDSFEDAAEFTDNLGLWFNGELKESSNLEDFLAAYGRDFLLTKAKRAGKIGLRPLLPVTADNVIDVEPITPVYRFTENHIIPGSFDISWLPLSDRKPFVALMTWRQQPTDDIGIIRTTEVRYAGTAPDGPFEQHDLSVFCASENHAVKAGAYRIAKRRYVSHTLRIKVRPGSFNTTLAQGDVVRVLLQRVASSAPAGVHDYLYEVDRIGKSRAGDASLDLIHFPIDDQGRSLVALDVAGAVGGGVLLSTGKSGTSCDVNADDDETVPADDSLDPDDWTLPDDEAFDVEIPDSVFGSGGGSDGGGGGGSDGGGGEDGQGNEDEDLDDQPAIPVTGGTPGGPIPGDTLDWPGCGCVNGSIDWYRDGEYVGNSRRYNITVADMGGSLTGYGRCDDIITCETPPIPVPFRPTEYSFWRFKRSDGSKTSWFGTASTSAEFRGGGAGIDPGGVIPWYIHSGRFTISTGGAGGTLGQILGVTNSTGNFITTCATYTGAVSSSDPSSSTDFPSPGVFEFAFSDADSGPDAWDEQWGGVEPP
jgi:hypothetical protein